MKPEPYETGAEVQQTSANLREREAARHIGVAPKTLANWRSAGTGPRFSRLGRAIVYRVKDLDRFVEERLQA